jgi:hypothetical protein
MGNIIYSTMKTINNKLVVVRPCRIQDQEALAVLKALDRELRDAKRSFQILIDALHPSVRPIQGGRIEVFMQAGNKPTDAFDAVAARVGKKCNRSVAHVKRVIVNHAVKLAKTDARYIEYQFDNFSLIINYKQVDAQATHIDLLEPHAQFGLAVSEQIPCTITYQTPTNIQCANDLRSAGWDDMPQELEEAMNVPESGIPEHLKSFGNVLHNVIEPCETDTPLLERGAVSCLPGSVLHAGPECDTFRAILFFSGSLDVDVQYNPDVQFFAPLLLAELIPAMWHKLTDNLQSRIYLLTKLADYVEQYRGWHVYRHFAETDMMYGFVKSIELENYKKGRTPYTRDEYIRKQADATHAIMLPPLYKGEAIDLKHLAVISIVPIWTEMDGDYFNAAVYSIPDKLEETKGHLRPVLIHHPVDGSWEGCEGGYTLQLNEDATLFDGTNGTLLDGDGEVAIFWKENPLKRRKPNNIAAGSEDE